MRLPALLFAVFASVQVSLAQTDVSREFSETILPVLNENCGTCHKGVNPRGPAPFLQTATFARMQPKRGLWANVAAQLRNRTMPPAASKLSEEDRLRVASWVEHRLRETACTVGEFAGPAVMRRLNRREYRNTIRDLLGIDFDVHGILPADGTGGAGFDTNGETLYVPPLLLERYLEAAQQILDRVIVTPPLSRVFMASALQPEVDPAPSRAIKAGDELSISLPVYVEAAYDVQVAFEAPDSTPKLVLRIDGVDAVTLVARRGRYVAGRVSRASGIAGLRVNLGRGSHTLTIRTEDDAAVVSRLTIQQQQEQPSSEKRALHYRLFGLEPGEQPLDARKAARGVLERFLAKAFRRPVPPEEADRFLVMYDRAAERGDPYEERVKLALKSVLVWPEFLFRIEHKHDAPGIHPLSQHELATRLSYFLWSTTPDEVLLRLADQARLQDPKVLVEQVDRMLDTSRSRSFTSSFIGQWLGTQDLGGRVAPLLTELQSYYTPDVAADLRMQPVLLFERLLGENRSLLELLNADYTHLTRRLAQFYEIEGAVQELDEREFRLVSWPDNKRAGLLGLGAVLAMTSRYRETSPVLRGAWALDTLLGTPVPPPPPEVPPLKTDAELGLKLGMKEKLMRHRTDSACASCHKLMDPIGFGLENFDWMGRWRDTDADGKPVDASGELPSGEKFNGPVELRQALLQRKEEFIRNVAGKVLAYALGRSLQDGDSCTVERIVGAIEKDNYGARSLIREVVLSIPFRSSQGGVVETGPAVSHRRLDVSRLNAKKQDNTSHNIVGVKPVKPAAKE